MNNREPLTHSLPSHIKPADCVTCHQSTLNDSRAALASAHHDAARDTLTAWITPTVVEHYPSEALAVCVALLEHSQVDAVGTALAQYLSAVPDDEGAMALLALALSLDTRYDEAEVVITQAIQLMHRHARSSHETQRAFHDIALYIKNALRARDGSSDDVEGTQAEGETLGAASESVDTLRHQVDHLKSVGLDLHHMQVFGLDSDVDDTIKDAHVADVVKLIDSQAENSLQGPATLVNEVIDLPLGLLDDPTADLDEVDESKVTEIISREASAKKANTSPLEINDTAKINRADILLAQQLAESSQPQIASDDSAQYVFDESLLNELGLSAIHDLSVETSELDSSLLDRLEHFADTGVLEVSRQESAPLDEDTLKHTVTGQVANYASLSEISDSMLSEVDLISESSITDDVSVALPAYILDEHDQEAPLAVEMKSALEPNVVDYGTTPWVKPTAPQTASLPAAEPQGLSSPFAQPPPPRVIPQPTAPQAAPQLSAPLATEADQSLRPSAPPSLSDHANLAHPQAERSDRQPRSQAVSESPRRGREIGEPSSAMQRLAEGALHLDRLPTPVSPSLGTSVSLSDQTGELQASTPQSGSESQAPLPNSRGRNKWVQALSLSCLFASALALASAFHSKSAHLLRRVDTQVYNLNTGNYKDLENRLDLNARHPLGRALDLLSSTLRDHPVILRRTETFHKLAWISTARWILHGESSSHSRAISALKVALKADPSRVEGRAALALMLWLGGQDTAARATARALPTDEWRRELVLGWIELNAGDERSAFTRLNKSYHQNPHSEFTGQLLGLINARRGLAQAMPYLQQQPQALGRDELSVYIPELATTTPQETWASSKRIKYLKAQCPQMQRALLNRVIPLLLRRGDRVSLQSLISELSISHESPAPLLLPAMIISLTELNVDQAKSVLDKMEESFQRGLIIGDDLLIARALWVSVASEPSPIQSTSADLLSPKFSAELGEIAGPQVKALLKETYHVHSQTTQYVQAFSALKDENWIQLERVALQTRRGERQLLWRQFSALARTNIRPSFEGVLTTLQLLERDGSTLESALLTQPNILSGVLASHMDPQVQGERMLKRYEQQTEIRLFKWLSRAWRCRALAEVSALGQWSQVCESASQENPRDVHSRQLLSLAFEELGRPQDALAALKGIPMSAQLPQVQRLSLRLNPELSRADTPVNSRYYLEILSAERQLRLSTFTRIIQEESARLSRHELYRGAWVVEAFDSPQAAKELRAKAISQGSTLAELDSKRQQLLDAAARGGEAPTGLGLPRGTKDLASINAFNDFIAIYNALSCLARNKALDLHHRHPSLNKPLSSSGNALRRLRPTTPPQRCNNLISSALTMEETHDKLLPLVSLSYAQLLISLGKSERAELVLKSLIEREPTQMEARLAYALLLLRRVGRPDFIEIRRGLGPLLDPTQGARLPEAVRARLSRAGGL